MSKTLKAILASVVSVIMVFGFAAVSYADDSGCCGGEVQAIYHIQSNTVFDADPAPTVINAGGMEETVADVMGGTCTVYSEGVSLRAFYASECPSCGKANGGYSVDEYLYGGSVCRHCGRELGTGLKVYRFIVVPQESAHYSAFHNYDFTNVRKSVFRETEKLYGDGRDLPQKNLIYETVVLEDGSEEKTLTGFETGFVVARSNGALFNAITGIQVMLEKMGNSKLNDIIFRFNLFLAESWSSFLERLLTL